MAGRLAGRRRGGRSGSRGRPFDRVRGLLALLLMLHFFTSVAIPPWAVSAALVLCGILPLLMLLVFVFVFVILAGRESSTVLPIRDYAYFVQELRTLWTPNRKPMNT